MNDIGFSGFAQLPIMRIIRYLIGLLDHGNIIRRMVFPDMVYKAMVKILRTAVLSDAFNLTGVDGNFSFTDFLAIDVCHNAPLPPKPVTPQYLRCDLSFKTRLRFFAMTC